MFYQIIKLHVCDFFAITCKEILEDYEVHREKKRNHNMPPEHKEHESVVFMWKLQLPDRTALPWRTLSGNLCDM